MTRRNRNAGVLREAPITVAALIACITLMTVASPYCPSRNVASIISFAVFMTSTLF